MSVSQIISHAVPTLASEDTGNRALSIMEEAGLRQLPVVHEEEYVALISESELLEWETPDMALSASPFMNFKPAISAHAHPFEAMRILHQMDLSLLPVVDEERKYLGTVTTEGLLKYITESSGIDNPGGVLVLEILPRNYTLYELARICENEDAIIINMQMRTNEAGMLEVTLKLNRTVLDAVVASFERHNYKVKEVYGEESKDEDIEGKYNLLMNYINM